MTTGNMDVDFVQFLDSMINLDALDRMTANLDEELKDSQAAMDEIKGMISSLPAKLENVKPEPDNNGIRHEDISSFLSDTPKRLMPDMDDKTVDVSLDNVLATMKSYAEDLKKSFTQLEVQPQSTIPRKNLEDLHLEQYAASLDQLGKRLSNLKLIKKEETTSRNAELEAKLSLLCDDVNMFIKMVQAKTTLSEAYKNWSPAQQRTHALDYDNLINKLLSGINEVSYLLQNKN